MMVLVGGLLLAVVTAVHELGHGLAVRAKRGRVLRVQIGRGLRIWSRNRKGTELVVSLLPFGGRIDYDGVRSASGKLIVAIGGAVANLVFSLAMFALSFHLLGAERTPFAGEMERAIEYAARSAGLWFWMVPGAVGELIVSGVAPEMGRSIRAILSMVGRGETGSVLYLSAAMSAVWAALNLIPVPGLRTDGWAALEALWQMLFRRSGVP